MSVPTDRKAAKSYELAEPDTTLGELASRLSSDVGELIRTHIELAKEETRSEISTAARAAALLVVGAVAALLAIFVLSFALAWGLAELMAPGLAFLIVGGVWAAVAAVAIVIGRKQFEEVDPTPTATLEEIQEDKQWLKKQR